MEKYLQSFQVLHCRQCGVRDTANGQRVRVRRSCRVLHCRKCGDRSAWVEGAWWRTRECSSPTVFYLHPICGRVVVHDAGDRASAFDDQRCRPDHLHRSRQDSRRRDPRRPDAGQWPICRTLCRTVHGRLSALHLRRSSASDDRPIDVVVDARRRRTPPRPDARAARAPPVVVGRFGCRALPHPRTRSASGCTATGTLPSPRSRQSRSRSHASVMATTYRNM